MFAESRSDSKIFVSESDTWKGYVLWYEILLGFLQFWQNGEDVFKDLLIGHDLTHYRKYSSSIWDIFEIKNREECK